MDVNGDEGCLDKPVALASIASKLRSYKDTGHISLSPMTKMLQSSSRST